MEQIEIYTILFSIIVIVGFLFSKFSIPISLILVITGMVLSTFFSFPEIVIHPDLVLNIFLPMLLYQISSFASWKDIKKDFRPIALLSIGHVLFITVLVAITIHLLIPEIGWPLAFVVGAVLSPPDDVAIVSIADKIRMPSRIVTILEGEGMLNDATALIMFRFALAATVTHTFSAASAFSTFIIVILCEIVYGLILGHALGKMRLRIHDPILNMMVSILTPFLAYLPAARLGGSGIIATVTTGFVIGHYYLVSFSPEFRVVTRAVWPTISFAIQALLYLLVGLNLDFILRNISSIPLDNLMKYSLCVLFVVIVGRFVWVYPAAYLPRLLFSSIRKKEKSPPWQYPFIISWAGMRGSISLAAAYAIPSLPMSISGANPKDLVIFLVFCTIIVTLVFQGLTLPGLLKLLGIKTISQKEESNEKLEEFSARIKIIKSVMQWLYQYKKAIKDDEKLLAETKLHIKNYKMLKEKFLDKIEDHNRVTEKTIESEEALNVPYQILEIEKEELLRLWHSEEISYTIRNKLLEQLDHRAKHI